MGCLKLSIRVLQLLIHHDGAGRLSSTFLTLCASPGTSG